MKFDNGRPTVSGRPDQIGKGQTHGRPEKVGLRSSGRMPMSRSGLAPLELVLCLFFLLVLMSLIINFGTTAPWHLRGSIAARNAVWRTLSIRTGGTANRPNPANWWAPAQMGLTQSRQFTSIPNDMVGPTWSQGDL